MPKYFSGEAKAEWKRLVGELLRRGTLTKIDRGILELHCVTYAHWRECIAEIVKGGAFVDVPVMDASGNVFMRRKKNIATDEAAKDAAAMRGFLIQLGATPAARKTQQLTREGAKRNEPAKPGSVGALFDAEEK
jgi:P27 family predicted phage terminase small subunit